MEFDIGIEAVILTPFGGAHSFECTMNGGNRTIITAPRRKSGGHRFKPKPEIIKFAD